MKSLILNPIARVCVEKRDAINYMLNDRVQGERTPREVVEFSLRGNTVWAIERFTERGVQRLVLMEYTLYRRDNAWHYEVQSEASGPRHYSCPLRYFETVPLTNPEWRRAVREALERETAGELAVDVGVGNDDWSPL